MPVTILANTVNPDQVPQNAALFAVNITISVQRKRKENKKKNKTKKTKNKKQTTKKKKKNVDQTPLGRMGLSTFGIEIPFYHLKISSPYRELMVALLLSSVRHCHGEILFYFSFYTVVRQLCMIMAFPRHHQ